MQKSAMGLAAFLSVLLAAQCVQGQKGDSPVTRVVKLLEDMRAQTESDAKADEEAYKKYECWCENSKKEKTEAVEVAQETIAALEASIEKAAGLEAQLKTEIEELKQDIAESEESLATAESLRAKENEEFLAVEAELNETLGTLKEAIAVLAKVQLVQTSGKRGAIAEARPLLLQLQNTLQGLENSPHARKYRSVMQQDLWDMLSTITVNDDGDSDDSPRLRATPRRGLSALERQAPMEAGETEEKPNEEVGNAAGSKSYNSRSGSILGLLEEMQDEFSRDLSSAQKAEAFALSSFKKLKGAKLREIAAATAQQKQKEELLATTVAQAAQDKKDIEATKAALTADEQVLLTLEKNCKEEQEAYDGRSKVRSEELVALSEAISILTSDDARDLFGKTVTKTLSFLQSNQDTIGAEQRSKATNRAEAQTKAVDSAMKRVLQAARRHKDWSLATLAVQMSLDPFTKVKEAMDKMLAELKAQQKEESEKNEFCKKQIDETEDTIKVKNIDQSDLEQKKLGLENDISVLEDELKELNKEISEYQIGLKQAGEDRKSENLVFQKEISENRESTLILQKAFARLEKFYMGNSTSMAQTKAGQEPGAKLAPPPPKPTEYSKSAGAGGVLQLLSQIMNDLKRAEAALIIDEQSAQKAYEAFAKDTNAAVDAKTAAITEKTVRLEGAKGEVSATSESLLGVGQELGSLEDALTGMHADCDFILKYYSTRQQARQEEMAAIVEAKAILSGADFSTAEDEADAVEDSR